MPPTERLESIDTTGGTRAIDAYPENNRFYHSYQKGQYLLPCDEEEKRRLDLMHQFFKVARRQALFSAPVQVHAPRCRVLDLGCGTGIWGIDLASKFPQIEIVGVDITNIQPPPSALARFTGSAGFPSNSPNPRFVVPVDVESDALWHGHLGQAPWDFVHARMLSGGIADWPGLYSKIFAHLTRGTGWFERVDIDWYPRCDDGSLPENAWLYTWAREVLSAFDQTPRSLRVDPQATKMQLMNAGFVNIEVETIKVPTSGWETDPLLKESGRWFNVGLTEGTLEAYALAPLTRIKRWTKEQVEVLIKERCTREVIARKHQAYFNMYIWTARRP